MPYILWLIGDKFDQNSTVERFVVGNYATKVQQFCIILFWMFVISELKAFLIFTLS